MEHLVSFDREASQDYTQGYHSEKANNHQFKIDGLI
jgi:hypothetical protein